MVGQALDIAGFLSTVPGQPAPIQPDSALLAVRFAIGPLPTIVLIIGMIFTFYIRSQKRFTPIFYYNLARKNGRKISIKTWVEILTEMSLPTIFQLSDNVVI